MFISFSAECRRLQSSSGQAAGGSGRAGGSVQQSGGMGCWTWARMDGGLEFWVPLGVWRLLGGSGDLVTVYFGDL